LGASVNDSESDNLAEDDSKREVQNLKPTSFPDFCLTFGDDCNKLL
jgi:hypothetical protein